MKSINISQDIIFDSDVVLDEVKYSNFSQTRLKYNIFLFKFLRKWF